MISIKNIKDNFFLITVIIAYIVLLLFFPSLGTLAIKNSGYYIKEMVMIMPVIFVLTALLDKWIPTNKIMQYLGKEAGIKGIFLSFLVGSISAGPIYAAFPMCKILYKKGATTRNIVIILSSWAVIKIPMLLNEAKYLGFKFMSIRWILTIISILIFSFITEKVMKEEDFMTTEQEEVGITIHKGCMGCGLCTTHYPEVFEMVGHKAEVKQYSLSILDIEKVEQCVDMCPAHVINYTDKQTIN